MKLIKYKKVQINKPDNISMKYLKKLVDTIGGDYSFSVDAVVKFISENKRD